MELIDFRREDDHGLVRVTLSQPRYWVLAKTFPVQPDAIDGDVLAPDDGELLVSDGSGSIVLRLEEGTFGASTVVVINTTEPAGENPRGSDAGTFIEFIRQSDTAIKEKFGIGKPGGDTLVGRTTVRLPQAGRFEGSYGNRIRPFESPVPDLSSVSVDVDLPMPLRPAVRIAVHMWSGEVTTGSIGSSSHRYLCPLRRLELVRAGTYRVSCGDMMEIFVNIAAFDRSLPGVRYVGAFQYWPLFDNLMPHSHALAEVFVGPWGKWVLIDVYYGLLFKWEGRYLGAVEIHSMDIATRRAIELVYFLPDRPSPFDRMGGLVSIPTDGFWGMFGTLVVGPDQSEPA